MYIKNVRIKNFRNFKDLTIPLNKFTILIGENDIGKSNFIKAIKLVLNNNTLEYSSKVLGITDFNSEKMEEFKTIVKNKREQIEKAIENKENEYINEIIPIIEIEVTFVDANDYYQKALLSDWLNEDKEGECYKVKYIFEPKDKIKFLNEVLEITKLGNEFLYQKGLGKRNLLLIILLFTNYINDDRRFNFVAIEEPEAHMCINNLNIAIDFISRSIEKLNNNNFNQILITTHNYGIINKLKFNNVVLLKESKAINFSEYEKASKYLAKRPNFDILKILLAKRVILVEGTTEEMFINTYLQKNKDNLNMAEVIVTGKGYKTFLDIWKLINKDTDKKIGVVMDYDNESKAKKEHHEYDNGINIFVRTTEGYTLEDDLVKQGRNKSELEKIFREEIKNDEITHYLKTNKAEAMYKICDEILEGSANIELPKHIKEIIDKVCEKAKCKLQEQEKHMD